MCGYKLKLSTSTFYIDSTIISQAVHVALRKRLYLQRTCISSMDSAPSLIQIPFIPRVYE